MIRKSRLIVALGLVMALSVSAIAFADGASEATPFVDGNIKPSKLSKKKYKPVELLTGVRTELTVNGQQQNPEAEFISFGKNLKWDSAAAEFCGVSLNGTTTEQARAACPGPSNIGVGTAAVKLNESQTITDETVTVFNGPAANQIRLHAYSPTLGASNTQVISGEIVNANTNPNGSSGSAYGKALLVRDAPDAGGDAFAIVAFNATITKASGVAKARCKAKKFLWERTVTYDDGTFEKVALEQPCKRKQN